MPTILTSRQFNQDTAGAKRATKSGPVFITDRGEPSHVLLSIEDYRKLGRQSMSLAEALAQKEGPDFDFEPPKLGNIGFRFDVFD